MSNATAQTPALLLTARETATALRISERSLWSLTEPRGPIPCIRLGRSVRYSPDALSAWIEAQKGAKGAHP